jgi:regulator of replication initiation timing
MKKPLLALCILSAMASPAFAGNASQDQIKALEARIKSLEANAEAMRQQAADAMEALQATKAEIEELKAVQPTQVAAAEEAPSPTEANANAFNPAISIILNSSYTHHSVNPDNYFRSGFALVGEGRPGAQGISLGESEISFATNIDEKFYGQLTLAVGSDAGEDSLGIEEAFIETTALQNGFTLRAGRFFSNLGYLNSHHAHSDKFFDRPLVYQAFLGNQYGDDGVQLRWLAPTNLFLEFGAEVFAGNHYPSAGGGNSGTGVHTLFAHAGGDVGDENSWLAGVSMLKSSTMNSEDGFSGDNTLYVADLTWKWAPQGNFKDGGITLRGEYFLDDRDGQYSDPINPLFDQAWDGVRHGAYIEAVYRINRKWETGYRYDKLFADENGPYASNFDPSRNSLMLTWINSEFSLVRLQYSRDESNPTDTDNALTLQFQTSLGAHGAHKF